jgi:hypothetical protein
MVPLCRAFLEADARIRTGDPFITSEVLYQLSYVGRRPTLAMGASTSICEERIANVNRR